MNARPALALQIAGSLKIDPAARLFQVARSNYVDPDMRCFRNVCPHRGAQVTRHRSGRARNFSCICHGWTFEKTGKVKLATRLGIA